MGKEEFNQGVLEQNQSHTPFYFLELGDIIPKAVENKEILSQDTNYEPQVKPTQEISWEMVNDKINYDIVQYTPKCSNLSKLQLYCPKIVETCLGTMKK